MVSWPRYLLLGALGVGRRAGSWGARLEENKLTVRTSSQLTVRLLLAGTTSVTVLAAELLREAEKLVTLGRVHPQTCVPPSLAPAPPNPRCTVSSRDSASPPRLLSTPFPTAQPITGSSWCWIEEEGGS